MQPRVPGDLNLAEFTFDNAQCHYPIGHSLVGNERAGVNVAFVDVIVREGQAQGLQVFGGEVPVDVRSRNAGQFLRRDGYVAGEANLTYEDMRAGQVLSFSCWRRWRRG